jgi:hypothetical protein
MADGVELLARVRRKKGGYRHDQVRKAVRRPPMATGVTTWAARRLATCGGPRPMAGHMCGRRRVRGSRVALA